MKRFSIRAVAVSLVLVIAIGIVPAFFNLPVSAEGAGSDVTVTTGTSGVMNYFKEDTYYTLSDAIDTPLTYEFELMAMNDIGGTGVRGGVIFGNYGKDGTRCVSIELFTYGKVRLYVNNKSGKVADITFSSTNIRKNSIRHVAITIDVANKSASLYLDGVFAETRTHENLTNLPSAQDFQYNFRIGGDHRSGNGSHFEGAIDSVALFSDIRTAEEIAADAKRAKTWSGDTDALVAAYDLTKQGNTALRDYSGKGNTLTYTNGSGILVENFGRYDIDKKLEGNPETVEAWLFLPNYYTARGGTFFGNNGASSSTPDIGFEIEYSGHPRFYYTTDSGNAVHEFGKVDVRTGTWQHVTIVHDVENSEARCYINGVLAETLAYTETKEDDNGGKQTPVAPYHTNINAEKYVLGGDRQNGYLQYFKGFLKEVRVYSDVRTAEEIASDYTGTLDVNDEALLVCYKLSQENVYTDIEDLSGNGYTAKYSQLLWDTVEPIGDYAYSFAVVGDTQTVTNHNPAKLKDIYQWIINNKTSKNIQYVIGLGDITEYGEDETHKNYNEEKANSQWTAAKEAITMMDGVLPYSLIRGAGHDGVEFFNKYFADHNGYTENITGYYKEGRVENVYHTFKIGNVDYMIICLDFGAKDDVLEWANGIVASYPKHRVIVTTHGYMEKDGSLLETGEPYCPSQSYYDPENNDGDDIWDKFVRKHANIFMVMCGHMSANDVIVSKQMGDHGNEVTQLLIDPQSMDSSNSPKGMVAMLYFSEDGEDVQVEYYSTLTDMWRPKKTFTVSYSEAEDVMQTPYGKIPAEYYDVNKYPIIVFNAETGEAVMATSNLSGENNAIGYCATTGGKHVIYVRKNVDSSSSNWNIGGMNGELIIDLNGNTVTVKKNTFLEFQGRSSVATVVKVINGSVVMEDSSAKLIGIGGKWGNGKKTNNVIFENVTVKKLAGGLVFETFGEAVITTSTIKFKNCRFEVDDGVTDKLIALGNHGTNTRAYITFEGGEFVFAGEYSGIYTTGGINMKKVYFSSNEKGVYPSITVGSGTGIPEDGFSTESGVKLDVIRSNGGYTLGICAHTYDNTCDSECNDCGYKREPPHVYNIPKKDDTHHWKECSCGASETPETHTYNVPKSDETYHWNECSCGASDTPVAHTYNVPKSDETYHWNECSCGATDEKLPHNYTAIDNNDTQHWNKCATCGTVDATSYANHEYANDYDDTCDCGYNRGHQHVYDTADHDDTKHWNKCSCCEIDQDSVLAHDYVDNCDVDCDCGYERVAPHNYKTEYETDDDQHWIICGDCDEEKPSSRAAHDYVDNCDVDCDCGYERVAPHNYNTTFEYDDDQHWIICGDCDEEKADSRVDHSFDNACDTDCVCGHTRHITHDYTVTNTNSDQHWVECSVCGTLDSSTVENHSFDNACDTDCACGYVRAITHDYSVTDKNDTHHWKKCSVCGTPNKLFKLKHSFDNACDTDCDCGYTRKIEHVYDGACDTKCNVCNEPRTTNTAHVYVNGCDKVCNVCGEIRTTEHTYSNACDAACNDCYAPRVPAEHTGGTATCTEQAVCTECGAGYGDLGEHVYGTEWGSGSVRHWHECSCGSKKDEAGHTFGGWTEKDGKRTQSCVCGYTISDPNYKTEESLPTGAIVGIIIAPVAAVGVVGFGVYYFVFKKKK